MIDKEITTPIIDVIIELEEGSSYQLPPEFLQHIKGIDFDSQVNRFSPEGKHRIITFYEGWERELRYDVGSSKESEGPFYFGESGIKLASVTRQGTPYKETTGFGSGHEDELGHRLWLLRNNRLAVFLYHEKKSFSPGSSTGTDETEWSQSSSLVRMVKYDSEGNCSCEKIDLNKLGLDLVLNSQSEQ